MAMTKMGEMAFISERIVYHAMPLATSADQTKYAITAQVLMGGRHIAARVRATNLDVYPSAIVTLADRLRYLIVQKCMDPEFEHPDVFAKDVRKDFELPAAS